MTSCSRPLSVLSCRSDACLGELINTILEQAFPSFITGSRLFLPSSSSDGPVPDLTHGQFESLLAFVRTRRRRRAALGSILARLTHSTRYILQAVRRQEISLVAHQRTDLVLCLLVGFLAYHVDDDDFSLYTEYTCPANVESARLVHQQHPEARVLSPSLVYRETADGGTFDFSRLDIFIRRTKAENTSPSLSSGSSSD